MSATRWDAEQGKKKFEITGKSDDPEVGPLALNPDLHVTKETPPTFLLQAEDDNVDGVDQALTYYIALKKAEVPTEMHLYALGGHAFGLRHTEQPITEWPELVERWLRTIGMISNQVAQLGARMPPRQVLRGGHLVAGLALGAGQRLLSRNEDAVEPDDLKDFSDAGRSVDDCELVARGVRSTIQRNEGRDSRGIDALDLTHVEGYGVVAHDGLQCLQETLFLSAYQFVQIARNCDGGFNNGLMIACHKIQTSFETPSCGVRGKSRRKRGSRLLVLLPCTCAAKAALKQTC